MAGCAPPELAARLGLPATVAVPGGLLHYAVINTGTVPIMLGESYRLERLTNDGWQAVAVPYSFRAWGLRLESGRRHELAPGMPEQAQPGRHRLHKRLEADRDPHPGYEWVAAKQIQPIMASAEFDVEHA